MAAAPLVLGAFQRVQHYRAVRHRCARMAEAAASRSCSDFDGASDAACDPVEVPIEVDAVAGHEWAVVVDAPGSPCA